MSIRKCTMVFEQGQYGWTETYWRDNANPDLGADLEALKVLTLKRIVLSGLQTRCTYLKISNETVLRDSLLYSWAAQNSGVPTGYPSKTSDIRFTAALIRRQNALNNATSNLLLRGIWDDLVSATGFDSNDTTWKPLFLSFAAELENDTQGWGFPSRVIGSQKKVLISNVTQNVTGNLVITVPAATFAGPPYGVKTKIFISGVKGAVLANGAHVVIPSSDTSCTTISRLPIFPYLGGGVLTLNTLAFQKIKNNVPLRAVRRSTGRPLFLSRGRSRVRAVS